MRVVIDIQACQGAFQQSAYEQRLLQWLGRLLQDLLQHEIVLLANRRLEAEAPSLQDALLAMAPDRSLVSWLAFESFSGIAASLPERSWQRRAAELLREHALATLQADVVLVLQPWAGWDSDAVFSLTGLYELPTWVVVPPHEVLAVRPVGLSAAAATYALWDQAVWQAAQKADRVLVWGDLDGWRQRHPELAELSLHSLGTSLDDATGTLQALLQDPEPGSSAGNSAQPAETRPPKPRLAYVSPLPPMASGIADYSAELIPALADYYELELIVDTPQALELPWGERYPVRSVAWFSEHAADYDRILYHFGNSSFHGHMVELLRHYPGTVVLHDFYLGHLFGSVHHSGKVPAALRRALFQSHGMQALDDWREQGEAAALAKYPCSFEIFAQADGVILHSAHAEALAQQWYGPELPCVVQRVPLAHASPPPESLPALREQARNELGLGADDVLVCSFGYAGAGKRSLDLVRAWQQSALASHPHCRLVLVGGHQMDGPARDALEAELRGPGAANVTLTGYVPPAVYRRYLAAADLAVQLRTDSRGETSRAVLDAYAHGVPLIVNAHGSAAELPQSTVVMLDDACAIADIAAALTHCLENRAERERLALAGGDHVRAVHAPEQVAPHYRAAIELAAAQGARSAAGRGRALIRTLIQESAQLALPSAAEVARLAHWVAVQAARPGARPVLPDTTGLVRPGRSQTSQPLQLLMVTDASAPSGARKTELQQRREAMALAYADMGMAVEHCDWTSLPALLSQWEKGTTTLPDVIQLDLLDTWLQLRPSWKQLGSALAPGIIRPGLVYDAWFQDKLHSLAGQEPLASPHEALQELAQAADLLLSANEVCAGSWIRLRERASGVRTVAAGGSLPDADRALTTAVYRDHLPQSPYALVLTDGHPQQVDDFLYFLGESLAYLPPDAMLLIVGDLGRELEQDPSFLRWRGINHSRCRFIVDPDELGMASVRRHAALLVLPRRSRLGDAMALTVTANALLDRVPILASSAALQAYEPVADAVQVMIEDTPGGFRRRLAQQFHQQLGVANVAAASDRQFEDGARLAGARWEAVLASVAGEVHQLAQGCRQRGGVAKV